MVVVLEVGAEQDRPDASIGFTAWKRHGDRLRATEKEVLQRIKRVIASNAVEVGRVPLESFQDEPCFQGVRTQRNGQIVRGLERVHAEKARVVDGGPQRRHIPSNGNATERLARDERQRRRYTRLIEKIYQSRGTVEPKPRDVQHGR